MADWSKISQDVLFIILQKLNDSHLVDPINVSRVCKWWRITTQEFIDHYVVGAPCLLIPGTTLYRDTSSQSRRLLAFPIGADISEVLNTLPKVNVPHVDLCCGSHLGWLVMIKNNMDMYLLNPFCNKRIDVPSVMTLKKLGYKAVCKWYVQKAFLSTSPSDEYAKCYLLVIYDSGRELAFYKLGDRTWKFFYSVYGISDAAAHHISDAVYFKSKWHLLLGNGEIHTCNLNHSSKTLTLDKVDQPVMDKWLCSNYLAESRGELFQIAYSRNRHSSFEVDKEYCEDKDKHLHGKIGLDKSVNFEENGDKEIFDTFDYDNFPKFPDCVRYLWSKTANVRVYKLNRGSNDSTSSWMQVNNFDGDALFLGVAQSFFLSNPHHFGYKKNHIYFTDTGLLFHKEGCLSGYDVGILDLTKWFHSAPL